jgi:EAL domain-containing protein (putative c-di-GMP-specific phosphodiesterase class I)
LRELDRVRATGIGIALDDVGHGHSNFKMIVDVRPEYLKLDRYFVEGIERDAVRQAIVECVVQLAGRVGARVVLEGVGTESELAVARALGVEIVQGFFFARPMPIADLRRHDLLREYTHVQTLDVALPESRSSDHGSP